MNNFFLEQDIEEIIAALGVHSQNFSGKSVMITGGAGFLGRYFCEVFKYLNDNVLQAPCKILVLDNFISSEKEKFTFFNDPHIHFVQHNVIQKYVPNRHLDYILHAAGIASPHYYRSFPLETLEVAINGTKNILDLAKENNARTVFFSSSEIYGDPDPKFVPTPETYRGNVASIGPRACYDESKRVGETLCHIYYNLHKVPAMVIRPFNVYGPGMGEKDYRVLPNFGNRIVAGQPLAIYGNGKQTRTFCYITDAINGFFRVLLNGHAGEPYNIGNPNPEISMLDLVRHIEEVLGKKVTTNLMDYPQSYPGDEPLRRCPDIQKAIQHLDYNPKIGISEGLKRFFSWALENYNGK